MEPKFNLNRPKISDEEIEKNKDFENLVKQFKEQSIQKARSDVDFKKNKKITYAAVIAGITVLCTLTYLTVFKDQTTKTTTNEKITTTETTLTSPDTKSKAFIDPPSSKLNVPYTSFNVNADKGGELAHHTKSKIKIPKNAFVNKKGEDIVGDVKIEYREFHNQADIIASGIPMTYDSAGTQYHFESAGMFDVKGTQNGEPVFIKPDKTITVELASNQPFGHFNQYELDTNARNWNCLRRDIPIRMNGKGPDLIRDQVPEKQVANAVTKELEKKIEAIPPKIENEKTVCEKKLAQLAKNDKKPLMPAKANGSRPQFELDVDFKEFPELAAYKNAVFEVGEENKNYSKELSKITWSEAKVSEGPDKGKNYLLTLKLRNRVEKLIVYPALSGSDYDNAIKNYEKKFADYNKGLEKREAEEAKLKEEMIAKQKVYMEEQKKLSADLLKEQIKIRRQLEADVARQIENVSAEQKVTRLFAISRFGIFNSDCPRSLPVGDRLSATFAYGNNPSISPSSVYLVEQGRNIVYNFSGPAINQIRYEKDKEYCLCLVHDGFMYFYPKDKFKEAIKSKNPKMMVEPMPEDMTSVSEFKKILGV